MYIFLIFALIILFLISLAKPRFGLYLILFFLPSYLVRYQFFGIPTTFLELAIYSVFIAWFIQVFARQNLSKKTKRLYLILKPFILPLALFFGAAIISTIISPDKRISLGVLKAWFFDPLLVLILFLDLGRRPRHIKRTILALFISASLIAAYGLYEYIFRVGLDSDGRLNSFFVPANYAAMFIAPILILSLVLIRKTKFKLLLITYYLSLIFALYLTKSYGGWLGVFAGLFFLWMRVKIPVKRLKYLLIFAFCVILVATVQAGSPKFGRLFDFTNRSSSGARSQIWQTSLLIIKKHPVLGVGLGNFEAVYRETVPKVVFPPLEWLVVKPHNLYLNLWIEMGFLGLASFFWLIFLFFKQGWRLRDDRLVKYAMAAMIVILVHGLVDTPYFKNDLAVLFWVIAAVVVARRRYSADEAIS
ncbi:hypothetical protein COT68_02080 [bacterium (Candidatus Torokbacteria) CG09_land_8_20_14_0_10_42_11]|nr:MAG: hypothetical protein COT68_02080 [bacterium (Candidatus Torokbacteria) CG09_land_8_20_14_0_10_42_11]